MNQTYNGTFKSAKFPHFLVHGNIEATFTYVDLNIKEIRIQLEMKGLYHKNLCITQLFTPDMKGKIDEFEHTLVVLSQNIELSFAAKKKEEIWEGTYRFNTSMIVDHGTFSIHPT